MHQKEYMNNPTSGYLELILGPMFSGKTSKLLEIYKQYSFCNISVAVINHSLDTRYHESLLSTHDRIMIPCFQTESLMNESCLEIMQKSQVILINEGQFFSDLYECILMLLQNKKTVYIAGLDGDFERKPFGEIIRLLPLCDNYYKLKSLCSLCKNGTTGIFSLRLTKETEQTLIGSNNYLPVCRTCYDNNS
uniref:thymidine kinase n=1 Tax=viral metagenome TaxID=1070528 RepID=A0A6C0B263_9ZZZZ